MDVVSILGWFACVCDVVLASNGRRHDPRSRLQYGGGAEVIKLH